MTFCAFAAAALLPRLMPLRSMACRLGWLAGSATLSLAGGTASAQLLDLPSGIPGYGASPWVTNGLPGYATGPRAAAAAARQQFYEPLGVRLGGFLLYPTASEAVGYDTNPEGQPNPAGSLAEATDASLLATSNWNRNAVAIFGGIDDHRYPQQSEQSTTDWTVAGGARYDLGRDQLVATYLHLNSHLTPRDLNIPQITEPEPYTADDFRLGYRAELARLTLTPVADFTEWRYANLIQNGLPLVLTYQSRNVATASLMLGYQLSDLHRLLVVARGVDTHFVQPLAGQPGFDSRGPDFLAGLDYDTGGVWHYRALMGYQARFYVSPAFSPFGGVTANAQLSWAPTGLTTLTASFLRAIEEDAATTTTVGYTLTHGGLVIDHEYSRNLLLEAHAVADQAAYQQGGGEATILGAGFAATWLLNRKMQATMSYDYNRRLSGGTSFIENVFLVHLRFAL
jgi:hypothetical protein